MQKQSVIIMFTILAWVVCLPRAEQLQAMDSEEQEPTPVENQILEPEVVRQEPEAPEFIEVRLGERFSDFKERYIQAGLINEKAITLISDTIEFPQDLGFMPPSGAGERKFEGMFRPGTYPFEETGLLEHPASQDDFNRNALILVTYLLEQGTERFREMHIVNEMPVYTQIISASIVEKETAYKEFYDDVAGVIYLRYSWDHNAKFHMCSTVEYILGYHRPYLLKSDLLETKSRYNLYLYNGFTPTPIAFFSDEALKAMTDPKPSLNRYFVVDWAKETMYFTPDYYEHKENARMAMQNFADRWGAKNIYRMFEGFYDTSFIDILQKEAGK